ncbi:MAG: DUF5615 family PIN-like protein [Cyanobacteria bacterium P01_A01_bin.40]
MRFLGHECTGVKVARWLREEGHEVFSVYEEARGITNDVIIKKAFDENWILITIVILFDKKLELFLVFNFTMPSLFIRERCVISYFFFSFLP